MNIGAAMNSPAWQAIVPELVPRAMLPDASAVELCKHNLARALGTRPGWPNSGGVRVEHIPVLALSSSQMRCRSLL